MDIEERMFLLTHICCTLRAEKNMQQLCFSFDE